MGHILVDARILNPIKGTEFNTKALVDTGATFTVIPWEIYEKLNLKVVGKKKVETAKWIMELDESLALLEIKGKSSIIPLLISKELKDTLIGIISLEALCLIVDPTTGELKKQEYYYS